MSKSWDVSGGDPWNDWNGGGSANATTWDGDNAGAVNPTNNVDNTFDSGHAGDGDVNDNQGRGSDGACHNCGLSGHFARECPIPRKTGPCYNCGEDGHTKAECPNPRVSNKPKVCARCKQEGDHDTKDCKNKYDLNLNEVPDMSEAAAWTKIVDASSINDMDDFKAALRMLQKAAPELTYPAIEKKLRAQKLRFYLIGLGKEVGEAYTLVNLAGEPGKTFTLGIFKSSDCQRPNMLSKWPKSPEENLGRLADAGVPMESGLPCCRNCSKFGHIARECEEEKTTFEGPTVQCALCGETGHRVRDCKEPRHKPREPRTCKVCGSEDHIAKECPEKPASTFQCRNCGGADHKAVDCTEPRKIICNNCSKEGHISKDCDQPRDWSKVKCRHCGEMGHASAARCAPGAAKKKEGDLENTENVHGTNNSTGDDWDTGNTSAGNTAADNGGGWETNANSQSYSGW